MVLLKRGFHFEPFLRHGGLHKHVGGIHGAARGHEGRGRQDAGLRAVPHRVIQILESLAEEADGNVEGLAQLQRPLRIGGAAIPGVADAHPDFVHLAGLDALGDVHLERREGILLEAAIDAVHVDRSC